MLISMAITCMSAWRASIGSTFHRSRHWYRVRAHDARRSDEIRDDFLLLQREALPNVKEYRVSTHGGTLPHFVSAWGRHKPLREFIDQYGFDVNYRNNAGDTPLICAIRSGHGSNIRLLLQIYNADPFLTANNGETALHWLVSLNNATECQPLET